MKVLNNRPFLTTLLVVLSLLITGVISMINSENLLVNSVRYLSIYTIYICLLAGWTVSLWRRIMHRHIKFYLLSIAFLMFLWISFRTVRYGNFDFPVSAYRMLWYCYYIPMILIPLFSFFASLCIGKPEDWHPRRKYHFLFFPAIMLILFILTNDYHQLAFIFNMGFEDYNNYSYGMPYYLVLIWVTTLLLVMVYILFKKSYIPYTKKRVFLPLITIGIGVVYAVLYMIDGSKTGVGFIEMTAMYCALTAGIWESCIQTGLISSNIKYNMLFTSSTLAVQIANEEGRIHYQSQLASELDNKTFLRLIDKGELKVGADILVHTWSIRGGYVIWYEDISTLNQVIEKLQETSTELQDGVDMLKYEIDTKLRWLKLMEQNRIYDLTFKQTAPQLQKMRNYIDMAKEANEDEKLRLLKKISFLGAYIKRKSNLILIDESGESITAEELEWCIEESFEVLRTWGASCALYRSLSGDITLKSALAFYDLFMDVIENSMDGLNAVFVTLTSREGDMIISIQIESPLNDSVYIDESWQSERADALKGRLVLGTEEGNVFYTALHLPKGGCA